MYVLITVNYNSATTSALMNTSATDHTPHHTHLSANDVRSQDRQDIINAQKPLPPHGAGLNNDKNNATSAERVVEVERRRSLA